MGANGTFSEANNKSKISQEKKLQCKKFQQNVGISNPITYKEKYTPQPSGIYLRYAGLIQCVNTN
jgi:hypothetical protein